MITFFKRGVLLLLLTLVASSCVTPPRDKTDGVIPDTVLRPIVSKKVSPDSGSSYLYRRGEELFSKKEYEQAANAYLNFVAESSASNRLIDNAYFKTGLSWFEMNKYRDALYYFSTVTVRYADSEVYVESLINMAICHFYLKNFKEAEENFIMASGLITVPAHNAYIFFYRAQIADNNKEYVEAASLYIESERNADNESLVKMVREKVEVIFHNFFSIEELEEITVNHPGQWASMIAFEELFKLYQRDGKTDELREAMETYRLQFPPESSTDITVTGDDTYEPDYPVIGVALPLTGSGARAGRELIQGIQLALNAHHELMAEKRIQLVIKDTASSVDGAEEALILLAEDQNTIAILGPAFSSSFERASLIAEQSQLPILSPSATAEAVYERGPHLFRNSMTSRLEGEKMADLAMRSLGHKNFAVIYPDTPGGSEVFGFFRQAVTQRGGMVLAAEPYTMDQTDFSGQIRRIGGKTDNVMRKIILAISDKSPDILPDAINSKLEARYEDALSTPQITAYGGLPLTGRNFSPGLSIKYDAIYILGPHSKAGLILPQLEFYNLTNVDRLAGRGANHPGLIKIAEEYSEGAMFIDGFYNYSTNPTIQHFTQRYRLAFRTEPSALSAQAYDAANIILSAISRGATNRRGVTDYLESLFMYEGVSGMTTMGPTGDADKEVFYLKVSEEKITEFTPQWLDINYDIPVTGENEVIDENQNDPLTKILEGRRNDFSDSPYTGAPSGGASE